MFTRFKTSSQTTTQKKIHMSFSKKKYKAFMGFKNMNIKATGKIQRKNN
jgi:hypothetical protein